MKMKKKLLYGILALVVIILAVFILIGRYTDRVIDPYVRSLLEEQKPMNHRIDYKKIRVNLFRKMILVQDFRMYPDSSLVKTEKLWFDVKVSTIHLTDFRIMDLLFHKFLIIGDLEMIKPTVLVYLPLEEPKKVIEDLEEKGEEIEKKEKKGPLLTSISLQRMALSDGTFKLIRNDFVLASSPDINLVLEDINLKKNNLNEPIGYTYGEVYVLLNNITLNQESGLYDMSLGSLAISKQDSSVVMTDFRMIPKYDKKEHYKNLNYTAERADIRIAEIAVSGIGYRRLLAGQALQIPALHINGVNADIYKDKNLPFDLTKFPLFYNESFVNIPIPLRIDTVEIINSKIIYNELAAGRTEAGSISLEDFSLQIYDITNQVKEDTLLNEMHAYVKARIMGEGQMNLELKLPLEGDLRRVECSGSVGAMKLSPLNAMLEPSINIKFNEGKVNRMTFYFTGNDNTSSGWMEFLYNDLDVVLLKKEPEKAWGLVSLLANTMALSNNPAPGKELKSVSIGCERDKNKGLINYVWRTIQSGMVHTILPLKKYEIKRNQKQKDH
jgi:hypothetical protein